VYVCANVVKIVKHIVDKILYYTKS